MVTLMKGGGALKQQSGRSGQPWGCLSRCRPVPSTAVTSPDELLRELGELATSLGPAVRPTGTDELLRSLTETARRLFGAAACSLALLSEDDSELVYTIAAGEGADDVTGMRIPSSQGIAGWVVQSGQPIAISDLASDPRFSREAAEQTGYVPQAILAVPVETPQRMLGVISLLDRDAAAAGRRAGHGAAVAVRRSGRAGAGQRGRRSARSGGCCWPRWPMRRPATTWSARSARPPTGSPAADADLAALAATFAALARRGAAERRLALAVLRDIGEYAERRPSRPR